jgi:hypothetical protein
LNPKELDIDHTLKFFQNLDFPRFCSRVLNFKRASISNKEGVDVHNRKSAWDAFIANEQDRYERLNSTNKPASISDSYSNLETNVDGVTLEYSKVKNSSNHVYIGKTGFVRNAESSMLGEITSFTINYSFVISSEPKEQNTYGFGYYRFYLHGI